MPGTLVPRALFLGTRFNVRQEVEDKGLDATIQIGQKQFARGQVLKKRTTAIELLFIQNVSLTTIRKPYKVYY